MYKLFLCLRYLRRRALAYFAIFGVMVCVFMMLVSVSVMSGFLWKIERAAKGLFGDIVIESASLSGLSRYDEFIGVVKAKVPRVQAASPFILTYGILRVPGTDYRQTVQIAGIRLPQRVEVSDMEDGLFVQRGLTQPTFTPSLETVRKRLLEDDMAVRQIRLREEAQPEGMSPTTADLVDRIRRTRRYRSRGLRRIENTQLLAQDVAELRKALAAARSNGPTEKTTEALEKGLKRLWDTARDSGLDLPRESGTAQRDSQALRQELLRARQSQATEETTAAVDDCIRLLELFCLDPPAQRIILGLGIPGFSFRSERGETIRHVVPGNKVSLTLMPLGKRFSLADPTPNTEVLTIIDDCKTDVSSIDSKIVYVPFTTLQRLTNMGPEYDPDQPDRRVILPRTSQIHVKAAEGITDEGTLRDICREIKQIWAQFEKTGPPLASTDVDVVTWRQLQAKVVGPIERQRTLVVMMFGIMWLVCVALIFVILYTIVVQKTRDIGVLKAVGGSNGGVATIFMAYGAVIGLVGSALGTLLGWVFIRNINSIEDWFYEVFSYRVWDREVFMFDKIPNVVDWTAAAMIVAGALVAGLIGALVPAVRAARMQPVEALRYE